MTTVLFIVLVVLIVANVLLAGHTLKRERARRRKLQERIDEYDRFVGDYMNEMGTLKESFNGMKDALSAKDRYIGKLHVDIKALKSQLDESGKGECQCRKDLEKSYEELAQSYHALSQRWENPSKKYLINHLIDAYEVKNITNLAKALGVSKSAISRMRK